MTDLIVLAIDPSKTVSRIAEHSNSWGWSPLIGHTLFRRTILYGSIFAP